MSEPERPWMPFDAECSQIRGMLKICGDHALHLKQHPYFTVGSQAVDLHEMRENVILAYRHIEDAVMRLGKAIQAYDGGKSVYDEKDIQRLMKAKAGDVA